MFGGGRQFGHSVGVADDSVIDELTARYLRSSLPRLLGMPDEVKQLEAQAQWTGIMGFSRDDLPWVGPVPEYQGVFVAAGYTVHGMPNAWLCGKAVARMAVAELGGLRGEEAVHAAVRETGLPTAYLVNEARVARARQLPTVLEQDHVTMFKAEGTE